MLHLLCVLMLCLSCSVGHAATEVKEAGVSKGYVNVLDFTSGATVAVTGIVGSVAVAGESDTLATVTGRGATTTTASVFSTSVSTPSLISTAARASRPPRY